MIKHSLVILFIVILYQKFAAKNYLIRTREGADQDDINLAYDDYKSITTIDDEKIKMENFDCNNKLILKGTIKRKVEEINHGNCKANCNYKNNTDLVVFVIAICFAIPVINF